MALLYDAAAAWDKLLNTSYQFTYGIKGTLHKIFLTFRVDQFFHLSGIHYVNDIDFGIPFNKANFLAKVLSGEIDASAVEKSTHWEDIKGRLESLVRLETVLDSDFTLYLFNKQRLPFYSNIDANFLLKNQQTGDIVFLFMDGPPLDSFCRSIFSMQELDYSRGQRKVGLLKKIKYQNSSTAVLLDKLTPPVSDNAP